MNRALKTAGAFALSSAGFISAWLMGAEAGATDFFAAVADEVAVFGAPVFEAAGCCAQSGAAIEARARSEIEMTFIARKV
jgi:hypothetical protein